LPAIEPHVRAILDKVGEIRAGGHGPLLGRLSLRGTHQRLQSDQKAIINGPFVEDYSEMILCRDIDFFSLCEHHLLPFFGKAQVAYIPKHHILGLSKLARLVEVFARRLQVQERMTTQIATTLMAELDALGVGVVLKAEHLCMRMRGVEKQNSVVVTSAMLGSFRTRQATRQEFMTLIQNGKS
jgi:GTP cyclohydrolase I